MKRLILIAVIIVLAGGGAFLAIKNTAAPAAPALGTSDKTVWLAKFPHAISDSPLTYFEIPETQDGKTFPLYAWLATPQGPGPHPVVILLHGCNGMFGTRPTGAFSGAWPQYQFWSDWLVGQGYAALYLDSFTGRGINTVCTSKANQDGTGGDLPAPLRAVDVYIAAGFLAQLPQIDPHKIVAFGDSHGAATVLAATSEQVTTTAAAKAALADAGGTLSGIVALYPNCKSLATATRTAPALVIAGSGDDWASPAECERLTNFPIVSGTPVELDGHGAPLTIAVYPGATHAFDVKGSGALHVNGLGYHIQYSAATVASAQEVILNFLAKYAGK